MAEMRAERAQQLLGNWRGDLLDVTGAFGRMDLPPELATALMMKRPYSSLAIVQNIKKGMDISVNPEAYPAPVPVQAEGDEGEQLPAQ